MRISRRVRGGGFQWAILPRNSLNHQFDAPGAAQVVRDFIVHICWDNSTDMQRTSCVAITPQPPSSSQNNSTATEGIPAPWQRMTMHDSMERKNVSSQRFETGSDAVAGSAAAAALPVEKNIGLAPQSVAVRLRDDAQEALKSWGRRQQFPVKAIPRLSEPDPEAEAKATVKTIGVTIGSFTFVSMSGTFASVVNTTRTKSSTSSSNRPKPEPSVAHHECSLSGSTRRVRSQTPPARLAMHGEEHPAQKAGFLFPMAQACAGGV